MEAAEGGWRDCGGDRIDRQTTRQTEESRKYSIEARISVDHATTTLEDEMRGAVHTLSIYTTIRAFSSQADDAIAREDSRFVQVSGHVAS